MNAPFESPVPDPHKTGIPNPSQANALSYTFQEIVSPEQYFGREHMEGLHKLLMPDVRAAEISSAFLVLVEPREKPIRIGDLGRKIDPAAAGLITAERSAVNLIELPLRLCQNMHNREAQRRVVQCGSAVTFIDALQDPEVRNRFPKMSREDAPRKVILDRLAEAFKHNFQT